MFMGSYACSMIRIAGLRAQTRMLRTLSHLRMIPKLAGSGSVEMKTKYGVLLAGTSHGRSAAPPAMHDASNTSAFRPGSQMMKSPWKSREIV